MKSLKTSDLVDAIAALGTRSSYEYHSGGTKIKLIEVIKPEGPIKFKRWKSQDSEENASVGSISINQLGMVASVFAKKTELSCSF